MAVTWSYCLSVFSELKQKTRELGMDNLGSQRIFIWWRNSSKRKAASGTKFGSGTSYTRKLHFSVEKLFCYLGVGVGWKLYFIACLGAKLHTTDRLYWNLSKYSVKYVKCVKYSGPKNSMLSTLLLVLCV